MVTFFVGVGSPGVTGYKFYAYPWQIAPIMHFGEGEWPYGVYFTALQVTGGNVNIANLVQQYALFYEGLKDARKGGQ